MSTTLSSAAAAALVGNSRDLVGEIFNRLPLSSVMRFRSVCKEWCSLSSTQSFIDMYQNINQRPGPPHCRAGGNNNNNNSCFVVQYFDNGTESKSDHFNTLFFNLELDDDDDNDMKMKRIREYMDLSNIFSSQVGGEDGNYGRMYKTVTASNSFFHKKIKAYYHIKLISSSRGFLLFTAKPPAAKIPAAACCCMAASNNNNNNREVEVELEYPALILYNPVTKEQLTVIAPPLNYVYCGFYYHSPTKEHRILYRLMGIDPHHPEAAANVIIVTFLVIELKNDYNFMIRRINLKCPNVSSSSSTYFYYLPDTSTPPVISNGSLHWIVSEDDHLGYIYYPPLPSCSHTILSFGMESEVFCWKEHPKLSHPCIHLEWGNPHCHKMNLLEMEGGGLGLCDGFDPYRMNLLEIYVMVDYEKWTWVRRYRIQLIGYIDRWKYGLHLKALQILQGDQLLLQVRSSTLNVEYALYSLNHHDKQLADKKNNNNKKKKRTCFQVVNIDRSKFGGRLVRMIIKPVKNKLVGNMVVLTPSLTSIFQHNNRSSTTTTTTTEIPIKFIFIENGSRLIP